MEEPRPIRHTREALASTPDLFKQYQRYREDKGKAYLGTWDNRVYVPMSVTRAIVDTFFCQSQNQYDSEVAFIACVPLWNVCKGIFRFDPTVLDAVWTTPLNDKIPSEGFYGLPEWCPYIETPGKTIVFRNKVIKLFGFYAHLEHDIESNCKKLKFVLDIFEERGRSFFLSIPLRIDQSLTILESCIAEFEESEEALKQPNMNMTNEERTRRLEAFKVARSWKDTDRLAKEIEPIISVVLYLCAVNTDIQDAARKKEKPFRPKPIKTKSGFKTFIPSSPTIWEVGYRVGVALRRTEKAEYEAQGGTHATPRTHIRRMHWHTYWTGSKKGQQVPKLKWLSPILVGKDNELIPTVHPVK